MESEEGAKRMYKSRSIIDSTDSESEAESRVQRSHHVNQHQAKQRAGECQTMGGRGRLVEEGGWCRRVADKEGGWWRGRLAEGRLEQEGG